MKGVDLVAAEYVVGDEDGDLNCDRIDCRAAFSGRLKSGACQFASTIGCYLGNSNFYVVVLEDVGRQQA